MCADCVYPRDKPGEESVTALAVCDYQSQFLAAHIVDSKGASANPAVRQVLRDLRQHWALWRLGSADGPRVVPG